MVMLEMAVESSKRADGAILKCQSSKLRVENDVYLRSYVFTVPRHLRIFHAILHKANGSRYATREEFNRIQITEKYMTSDLSNFTVDSHFAYKGHLISHIKIEIFTLDNRKYSVNIDIDLNDIWNV